MLRYIHINLCKIVRLMEFLNISKAVGLTVGLMCKDHTQTQIYAMWNTTNSGDNPVWTYRIVNRSTTFNVLG
jgi:hypothetical protein